MLGRPDMDAELPMDDNDFADSHRQSAGDECVDEGNSNNDDDDGSDDGWGDLTANISPSVMKSALRGTTDTTVEEEADGMFFVPEPVVSLLNDNKPCMPMHSIEALPPGSRVWIVDEDDVKMLLKDNWDVALKIACNGRECGTVVRHNGGDLTLVAFENKQLGMKYSFTFPRPCLSLEKIEQYDSSPKAKNNNGAGALASSFGVGNLGPRAGRGTAKVKDEVNLLQQYYETMPANVVLCDNAAGAWEMFAKGKVEAAQQTLESLMDDDVLGEFRKEHLSLRSTMRIFAGNPTGALADALKVIEMNPSWVKGYLRAARAYKANGKFTLASHMINQTLLLLPYSLEIQQVSAMNNFLRRQQMELEALHPINFRLDAMYMKKIFPKRGYQAGEVVYEESDLTLSMASMQNLTPCCCVCQSPDAISLMNSPTVSQEELHYCSQACQQRSSLFLPYEKDRHALGTKSASGLVFSKAASSMNMLPLEQARLTMRLFFIVCTTHQRLCSRENSLPDSDEQDEATTVEDALRHLGIFPFVSSQLDNKTKEELIVLCNVMCQYFSEEHKKLYSSDLFVQLYSYVAAYVLYAESTSTHGGKVVKGYHLARLCGGVDRCAQGVNCEVKMTKPGCIALVATTEILKEDKLVIAPLRTTQQ